MSEVDRLSNSGLYPTLPIADKRKCAEQQYAGVADRVDAVESRSTAGSFDEAIEWARRGADASRLAQQFGLSRTEAELVSRLHGRKRA
jgi:hypothetical protein